MRIVFTRFPLESALGGAEIQTLSLMEGLRQRGHDVAFLGSCPVLLRECGRRGIRSTELSIGPPPVTWWHAMTFLWRRHSMRTKLQAACGKYQVDAICMLSLSEKILLTESMALEGRKVLWIEHDRIGRWLRRNPWLGRLRAQSRFATTVTVSILSRRLYAQLGWREENLTVIPNGIDLERFGERTTSVRYTDTLVVGCVTRLAYDKGVDLLIEAAAALPQVHLGIVGSGPERAALCALISSKPEASGRIHLRESGADLGAFYAGIDLLVLPSRDHDPFGLVAAEAMALGIPVIVTDQCGIADFLTDGTDAIVVEANSVGALQDAILRMTDPSARGRIGAAGRATTRETFSRERMVNAYERLLGSGSVQGSTEGERREIPARRGTSAR